MITYDYDPKRPSLTTFDARELAEAQSRNISAHHVLYALDVCQAGLAVYHKELGSDEKSDKEFGRLSVIRADVEPIARNILVAGTEGEDALWDNGGVFTEALIHGLRGGAERGIGLITFEDLAAYVRERVIAKAAKTQVRQEPFGKVLDEYGEGRIVFIPNRAPALELQQPSKGLPMER